MWADGVPGALWEVGPPRVCGMQSSGRGWPKRCLGHWGPTASQSRRDWAALGELGPCAALTRDEGGQAWSPEAFSLSPLPDGVSLCMSENIFLSEGNFPS